MPEPADHLFQVDLRGMIDLLSHHLYSSPAVFVREILQNAVDAIQARRTVEPEHGGKIAIELVRRPNVPSTVIIQDDGIGLTEPEIHQFLATIGQSSKRGQFLERPGGFIGQFGIGLLSAFMVSDQIVVLTRSAKPGEPGVSLEWIGNSDGSYSLRKLETEIPFGAQVFLRARPSAEEYFDPQRLESLIQHYGAYLEPPITLTVAGEVQQLNETPPWIAAERSDRDVLLAFGRQVFDRSFFDVMPLHTQGGQIRGAAFILGEASHAGAKHPHRVYLKNMLLTTQMVDLLPEWAFFAQCIINTQTLTPTASRESFYEDEQLEQARAELGACLKNYLQRLAKEQPDRLHQFIEIHHLAVKSLAVNDLECLELFADWLPFETSLGTMTLGEFRREHPKIRYVHTRDQFRQIAQVAAAESIGVVNAGYVYDVRILERLAEIWSDVEFEPFDVEDLSHRFHQLTAEQRARSRDFEALADAALHPFQCVVEIAVFHPTDLPALFVSDGAASFLRTIDVTKDVSDKLWESVLESVAEDAAHAKSQLYLNFSNPLIQRLCDLRNEDLQSRCVEMLYVQSLLLGHFPLKRQETQLLSSGLLGLVDRALEAERGKS